MRDEIAFMFSGQGSQYLNMGRELYESMPSFRRQIHALDEIPQDLMGISIVDIIYRGSSRTPDQFDNILHTHPALFMVQYSLAQCLINEGIKPKCLIGCSLGEWVALSVGRAIDPAAALQALIKQAIIFSNECPAGGMMAILERPEIVDQPDWTAVECELAAVNFASHFCVSGSNSALQKVSALMEKRGAIFDFLPVKQPFHSSLIDPLRQSFIDIVEGITIREPQIPIISVMAGGPKNNYTSDDIWRVVRDPILFYKTLKNFEAACKPRTYCEMQYLDVGPSGTLANFVKYGLGQKHSHRIHSIMSPFGNDLIKYRSVFTEKTENFFYKGA
jgi:bacillaene synthase trans-acting acyltransferase